MRILLVSLFLLGAIASAQQPDQKPNVFLENNRPKNEKESNTRTIQGMVKDASENPIRDAIVQLKDTKTSKIVDFATKDDGKFVFRDLPMDINYELVAKHGDVATPVKKVSVYDTRKNVVVNFELAAAKP
jgi:Carboxypeptidase regulatory-like domain